MNRFALSDTGKFQAASRYTSCQLSPERFRRGVSESEPVSEQITCTDVLIALRVGAIAWLSRCV